MNKIPFYMSTVQEWEESKAISKNDPESFWSEIARNFTWNKTWDRVLEWEFNTPKVQWFKGAELNITENCIDRHLPHRANQTAIIWEPNDPREKGKKISYSELHAEVCRLANVLKQLGVNKGDRVVIYLPMIPELAYSVLACARIGAIHSVVFAGFSAQALADRVEDAKAKLVITSDGMYRGARELNLKRVVDQALDSCLSVSRVLVVRRTDQAPAMKEGRDYWLHDLCALVNDYCSPEPMGSEDKLFILYTSGSTGKPKGVVHACGAYMVYAGYTFKNVFQYEEGDVFWCTADVGWITGHSYIVYGPLLNGATTLMFEGVPTWPSPGRFWEVIDQYGVNQFYTAPTAIRSLMACGLDHVLPYSLNSLKVLGSVGEPINEEAWNWYYVHVGKERCPILDTWWQTETGGIMISGLGSLTPMKAAHAGYPLPGIEPVLLDSEGHEIKEYNKEGLLCIRYPWPGILKTIYGDHERCRLTYFSAFNGHYFTGDGAKRDENGMYRIIGRVDDVINVSGHRFGTAEIENAINAHRNVAESAVVGFPHEIKGQGIYAFVLCKESEDNEVLLRAEIIEEVNRKIGKIARPDKILFVRGLPKTRSGKIMRRLLRKIASNELDQLGDVSTLLDPEVVQEIIDRASTA